MSGTLWGSIWLGVLGAFGWQLTSLVGRLSRRAFPQIISDGLYILLLCYGNFVMFLQTADGQVRWFFVLLEGAVGLLTNVLLARRVIRVAEGLLRAVDRGMRRVIAPVIILVKKIARKLWNILKKPFIFIKRYIIISIYHLFEKRKRRKASGKKDGQKDGKIQKDKEQTVGSRFYH